MGSILKRNIKIWFFQNVGKSQNKAPTKEIGCRNDIVLSKIG